MTTISPTQPTQPSIEVYWRPGCVYCRNLRRTLKRHGIVATWHNIWRDDAARSFVAKVNRGNETVPTVRVGDQTLTNPTWSQLAPLLNDASRGAGTPRPAWVRALSGLPIAAAIVASFALEGAGLSGLSWAMDGVALVLWWATRGLRR